MGTEPQCHRRRPWTSPLALGGWDKDTQVALECRLGPLCHKVQKVATTTCKSRGCSGRCNPRAGWGNGLFVKFTLFFFF